MAANLASVSDVVDISWRNNEKKIEKWCSERQWQSAGGAGSGHRVNGASWKTNGRGVKHQCCARLNISRHRLKRKGIIEKSKISNGGGMAAREKGKLMTKRRIESAWQQAAKWRERRKHVRPAVAYRRFRIRGDDLSRIALAQRRTWRRRREK